MRAPKEGVYQSAEIGSLHASQAEYPSTAALRNDFIWGVSTSSFQIEGATKEGGRGLSVWDTYCSAGHVTNHDTGDIACDHYRRYRDDVALMRRLGVQAYRFSISWPRVLPLGRGKANELGLAFYDRLIDQVMTAGIEPWLCLYHWDLPQALDDCGGWTSRDSVDWFADYAALVAQRYGDRIKRFATLNEPSIFTLFGLGFGGKRATSSAEALHRGIHHINLAHGAAVDVLRAGVPQSSIGVIHNWQPCLPSTPADAAAARLGEVYWNKAYPDPQCLGKYPEPLRAKIEPYMQAGDVARIQRPLDWLGVNHYGPVYLRSEANSVLGFALGDKPTGVPLTPIGAPILPDVFKATLLNLSKRYSLPIYVLESGMGSYQEPDASGAIIDTDRIAYLRAYIGALNDAVAGGADVRGYFVWSLLDNFEWDSGYAVRFGLTYVDYKTQRRIPKASFEWYRKLIKATRCRQAMRGQSGEGR